MKTKDQILMEALDDDAINYSYDATTGVGVIENLIEFAPFRQAMQVYSDQFKSPKWIKASERLMKEPGIYFCKSEEGVKHTAEFTGVHLMARAGYYPDYWLDESPLNEGKRDEVEVEDLQKQVRDHIKQDQFHWDEALTDEEMAWLEQLLLTFAPMFSPGSIGFEKTVRPYLRLNEGGKELEEAAKAYAENNFMETIAIKSELQSAFIAGAKWKEGDAVPENNEEIDKCRFCGCLVPKGFNICMACHYETRNNL